MVFRFYSKVLSKCRKCHFRDLKFKTFWWRIPPRPLYMSSLCGGPIFFSHRGPHSRSAATDHDDIDDFHKHINEQNIDIQFTKEIEENGTLLFLDYLLTHDNNKLRTTVYRKPTHTDRLLDQSSYNPTSHKATTIKALTTRAQLICDSQNALQDENDYLPRVFYKKNYNSDFIKLNTYKNTDERNEQPGNLTYLTTLQHSRSTQTNNNFTTCID